MKLCLIRVAATFVMAWTLSLTACSTISSGVDAVKGWIGLGRDRVALRSLTLVTDEDASGSSAVRIDIVAVFDNSAALILPTVAQDWFLQRKRLMESLPDVIAVRSYEVPPGRLIKDVALPENIDQALGARAYVELRGPGDPMVIDISKPAAVTLHIKANAASKITRP